MCLDDIKINARCMDDENSTNWKSEIVGKVETCRMTGDDSYRYWAAYFLVTYQDYFCDKKDLETNRFNLVNDQIMDIIKDDIVAVVDQEMKYRKNKIENMCEELERLVENQIENQIENGVQSQIFDFIIGGFLMIIDFLQNPPSILICFTELRKMVIPALFALDESKRQMIRTMQDFVDFIEEFENMICDEWSYLKQEYFIMYYDQLREKYDFRGLAERTQKIFERLKSREKE